MAIGFYHYALTAEEPTQISSKKVQQFFIGLSSIYYVTAGYDEGLYKIHNGITSSLDKEPAYS